MNILKKFAWAVIFVLVSMGFVACNADDETAPVSVNLRSAQSVYKTVSGVINSNTTWYSDTIYQLDGKVYVSKPCDSDLGVVLTIQAGTRIEGLYNADPTLASALVITRGSKIHAVGEECNPIVFTAENGTKGGWGGLVLLGRAINNQGTDILIEGIDPSTAPECVDVYYGGTDSCDNSGILSYVRVEFAGAKIADDNELNSFTFGSVGCGTQLDHLQAYYGADDGFEWFGGCVCARYLISTAADDDAFDFDFGYTGKLQFLVSVIDPEASYSANANGIECDNNATGALVSPYTRPVISNLTAVGTSTGSTTGTGTLLYGAHFRRATRLVLRNSILYGYKGTVNNAVVYFQGSDVTDWLGTDLNNTCSSDSSYVADNVIGLISGANAFAPATPVPVTVKSSTPNYTAITLNAPFNFSGFFSTATTGYALRPTAPPALKNTDEDVDLFEGLDDCPCCNNSSWFDTTPDYKGAIGPDPDEYWIAACWVNTDFPL